MNQFDFIIKEFTNKPSVKKKELKQKQSDNQFQDIIDEFTDKKNNQLKQPKTKPPVTPKTPKLVQQRPAIKQKLSKPIQIRLTQLDNKIKFLQRNNPEAINTISTLKETLKLVKRSSSLLNANMNRSALSIFLQAEDKLQKDLDKSRQQDIDLQNTLFTDVPKLTKMLAPFLTKIVEFGQKDVQVIIKDRIKELKSQIREINQSIKLLDFNISTQVVKGSSRKRAIQRLKKLQKRKKVIEATLFKDENFVRQKVAKFKVFDLLPELNSIITSTSNGIGFLRKLSQLSKKGILTEQQKNAVRAVSKSLFITFNSLQDIEDKFLDFEEKALNISDKKPSFLKDIFNTLKRDITKATLTLTIGALKRLPASLRSKKLQTSITDEEFNIMVNQINTGFETDIKPVDDETFTDIIDTRQSIDEFIDFEKSRLEKIKKEEQKLRPSLGNVAAKGLEFIAADIVISGLIGITGIGKVLIPLSIAFRAGKKAEAIKIVESVAGKEVAAEVGNVVAKTSASQLRIAGNRLGALGLKATQKLFNASTKSLRLTLPFLAVNKLTGSEDTLAQSFKSDFLPFLAIELVASPVIGVVGKPIKKVLSKGKKILSKNKKILSKGRSFLEKEEINLGKLKNEIGISDEPFFLIKGIDDIADVDEAKNVLTIRALAILQSRGVDLAKRLGLTELKGIKGNSIEELRKIETILNRKLNNAQINVIRESFQKEFTQTNRVIQFANKESRDILSDAIELESKTGLTSTEKQLARDAIDDKVKKLNTMISDEFSDLVDRLNDNLPSARSLQEKAKTISIDLENTNIKLTKKQATELKEFLSVAKENNIKVSDLNDFFSKLGLDIKFLDTEKRVQLGLPFEDFDVDVFISSQQKKGLIESLADQNVFTKNELNMLGKKFAQTVSDLTTDQEELIFTKIVKLATSLDIKELNKLTKGINKSVKSKRLLRQIARRIRNGKINVDGIKKEFFDFPVSNKAISDLFTELGSVSGKELQRLSQFQKLLNKTLGEERAKRVLEIVNKNTESVVDDVEGIDSKFIRVKEQTGLDTKSLISLWQSLIVSGFTSFNVAIDNVGNIGLNGMRDLIIDALDSISKRRITFTRTNGLLKSSKVLAGLEDKETRQFIKAILNNEDILKFISGETTFASSIGKVGKFKQVLLEQLKVADELTSGFTATIRFIDGLQQLNKQLLKQGKQIIKPVDLLRKTVLEREDVKMILDKAVKDMLDITLREKPKIKTLQSIIKAFDDVPLLKFFIPFPKVIINQAIRQFRFSPFGLIKLINLKNLTRDEIAQITGEAFAGSIFTVMASQIRDSKFAGSRFNEIKIGDRVIDTRPLGGLSFFLFLAEAKRKGIESFTSREIFEQVTGVGRLSGIGLILSKLFFSGKEFVEQDAKKKLLDLADVFTSSFTTPLPIQVSKRFVSVFDEDERKVVNIRSETPFVRTIGKLPFGSKLLEEKDFANFIGRKNVPAQNVKITGEVPVIDILSLFTSTTQTKSNKLGQEAKRLKLKSSQIGVTNLLPELNNQANGILANAVNNRKIQVKNRLTGRVENIGVRTELLSQKDFIKASDQDKKKILLNIFSRSQKQEDIKTQIIGFKLFVNPREKARQVVVDNFMADTLLSLRKKLKNSIPRLSKQGELTDFIRRKIRSNNQFADLLLSFGKPNRFINFIQNTSEINDSVTRDTTSANNEKEIIKVTRFIEIFIDDPDQARKINNKAVEKLMRIRKQNKEFDNFLNALELATF